MLFRSGQDQLGIGQCLGAAEADEAHFGWPSRVGQGAGINRGYGGVHPAIVGDGAASAIATDLWPRMLGTANPQRSCFAVVCGLGRSVCLPNAPRDWAGQQTRNVLLLPTASLRSQVTISSGTVAPRRFEPAKGDARVFSGPRSGPGVAHAGAPAWRGSGERHVQRMPEFRRRDPLTSAYAERVSSFHNAKIICFS